MEPFWVQLEAQSNPCQYDWLTGSLLSETLQIDSILQLANNHYFTIVEENFETLLSETLQIDSILLHA